MALVSFINVEPRHSANHSIGRDFPRLLKLLDRALSFRSEDTINGPGIVSQGLEGLLQVLRGGVIRSLLQYRFCHCVPSPRDINPDWRVVSASRSPKPPLERKHSTDQGLPGNRTNDSVCFYGRNVERKGLLKPTHRSLCLWSEDPIDLGPITGIARQVAELELLLHSSNRVALTSLFDLHDKSRPRYGTDNPVGPQPMVCLKRFHRGSGLRTEHAVDDDAMPARPQQILQRFYRVPIGAALDHRPRADAATHNSSPANIERNKKSMSTRKKTMDVPESAFCKLGTPASVRESDPKGSRASRPRRRRARATSARP